jgi:hypothetical protein
MGHVRYRLLQVIILMILASAIPLAQAQIGTPVDIGSNTLDSGTTTLSVTTTQAVPAGASIIVIASGTNTTGEPPTNATCSDSAAHTYNVDRSLLVSDALTGLTTICSTHGLSSPFTAGALTITVTYSGGSSNSRLRMHAFSVTGLAGAPLDQTAANGGLNAAPSSGATAVTAQPDELLFSAILLSEAASVANFSPGTNGAANNCASTGSPTWSGLGSVGGATFPSLFGMYCQVSAAGSYSANATISGTEWEALIVTYRGAATHFTVSAPSTAIANGAFNFTVTAVAADNTTATHYGGIVHFTSTDGQAVLPANSTLTNGTGSFSATLKTLGTQTITAADTLTSSIAGTSNNVSVGVGPATHFSVSLPSSPTAGSSFNFTVSALDQFNNIATGYGGTVHFTSSDSQATLPADYPFAPGDAGVHTFAATLKTSGTRTITATDTVTASTTGASSASVSAATATHFSVSSPLSAAAGNAFAFTVTALDQFNNTATGYGGQVHFTSTDGQAVLPANSTLASGSGSFSATLKTAGNQTLTATDTVTASITGASSVSVTTGTATHFTLSTPSSATSSTAFTFTVTALDQFNNTATGYGGQVHFTSSDGQAVLPANSTLASGTGSFSATLKTAGSQTLTATDTVTGSITGASSVSVTAGAATHFLVSAPSSATGGTPFNFTVTAQDAGGNTVAGYSGTVHFTTSDGGATLPADSTLTTGAATFPATLRTSGTQTIIATDTLTASINGTSNAVTVNVVTGSIQLLAACPANGNWSNPACWNLNRAPVSGDDVMIGGSGQPNTNYDLGGGVLLHSITVQASSAAGNVTGGPIGLQSGGFLTDNDGGIDTLPSFNFGGVATISVTLGGGTLRVGALAGSSGFTKNGPGTLQLTGAGALTGGVTVSGGALNVTGSLPSAVTVGSGGTLTGAGTVLSIAALSGGAISGNLTVTGGVTFAAGSSFNATLDSSGSFSQLTAGGTVDLSAGPALNVTLGPGFSAAPGTAFTLVPGAVTGKFTGLANGGIFTAGGVFFRVNYASVTLTVISAPSIPALSGWALALLGALLAGLAALALRAQSRLPV